MKHTKKSDPIKQLKLLLGRLTSNSKDLGQAKEVFRLIQKGELGVDQWSQLAQSIHQLLKLIENQALEENDREMLNNALMMRQSLNYWLQTVTAETTPSN